jgi:hypothetical protein
VRSRLSRALDALRRRLDEEHGGDRSRWAMALVGPEWKTAPPPAATGTAAKGVIVMSTQTKVAAAAAVLLALVVLWWTRDGGEPAPAAPKTVAEATPAPAPAPRAPHRAGAEEDTATTAESAPTPAAAAPVAATGPKRLEVREVRHGEVGPAVGAPEASSGPRTGEVTISLGASGGGGAFADAGWTKWKPVPEKGTATLTGKVLDATGAPLAGAQILRVDPAAGGRDGDVRDYRHITPLGESAADGTFTFAAQPARAYRLVANWHETMSRPTGLLLSGLVAVEPQDKQTLVGIVLRVPVDPREFGAVTGRVVDDEGAPVATVLFVGYVSVKSGDDGRFRLAPVHAGDADVAVSDYDFRPSSQRVTVKAGADTETEVRVVRKVTGPHDIDGFVRDADGKPVMGVPMMCGGVDDLCRRQVSGADGSFRFRHLPPAPEGQSYYVCVNGPGVVLKTVQGIAAPAHGLAIVAERAAKLRVVVRDAATGAVLPLFNVSAGRRVVEDGQTIVEPVMQSTEHEESGEVVVDVPPCELELVVEAPERRAFHCAVTVPKEPGEYEVRVEMQR